MSVCLCVCLCIGIILFHFEGMSRCVSVRVCVCLRVCLSVRPSVSLTLSHTHIPSLFPKLFLSHALSLTHTHSLCQVMSVFETQRDTSEEGLLKDADLALLEVSPTSYICLA